MRHPYAWLRHALIVARLVRLSGFCDRLFNPWRATPIQLSLTTPKGSTNEDPLSIKRCSSNSIPTSMNDAPRCIIGGPLQGPDPFRVFPFSVG